MKTVGYMAAIFCLFSFSAQAFEKIAMADRIKLDEAKKIIPKLINGKKACFVSSEFKFPIEYSSYDRSRTLGKQLKSLEKAGLMKSEKKKMKATVTTQFSKKEISVVGDEYTLTDLGKKYFKEDAEQWFSQTRKPIKGPGFCYGEVEVMTVHRMNGVNNIEYYFKVNNKPDWATTNHMGYTGLIMDYSSMKFKMKGIPEGKQGKVMIRRKSGEWKLHYYR